MVKYFSCVKKHLKLCRVSFRVPYFKLFFAFHFSATLYIQQLPMRMRAALQVCHELAVVPQILFRLLPIQPLQIPALFYTHPALIRDVVSVCDGHMLRPVICRPLVVAYLLLFVCPVLKANNNVFMMGYSFWSSVWKTFSKTSVF